MFGQSIKRANLFFHCFSIGFFPATEPGQQKLSRGRKFIRTGGAIWADYSTRDAMDAGMKMRAHNTYSHTYDADGVEQQANFFTL